MSQPKLRALFQRIGGEPKMKIILRDFYQRMSQDLLIGYFFSGKDSVKIADHQLQFLLYAAGMNSPYKGKSPSLAHAELPRISQGHFDRRLVLLTETLRHHGLAEEDVRSWVHFENAFRDVIVSKQTDLV